MTMTNWLKRAALTVRSLFPIRTGAGAIALAIAMSAGSALAQTCPNTLTGSTAVPAGFGAAFDATDNAKPLIAQVTSCTSSNINFSAGRTGSVVASQAYYWTGTAWQSITLSGAASTHAGYLDGVGTATVPWSTATVRHIVAFVCRRVSDAWKCGCADATCSSRLWNLQTTLKQ